MAAAPYLCSPVSCAQCGTVVSFTRRTAEWKSGDTPHFCDPDCYDAYQAQLAFDFPVDYQAPMDVRYVSLGADGHLTTVLGAHAFRDPNPARKI